MSAESRRSIDLSELFRFATATALTILILFVAWKVVLLSADDGGNRGDVLRSARGISTSIAVALVIYLMALRRERDRLAQLREGVRSADEKSRGAESLLDAVMEASPAAVLVVDEEHQLIKANRVATQLHGEELVGRACEKVFDPADERCGVCTGCETLETQVEKTAQTEFTEPRTGAVLAIRSHPAKLADGRPVAVIVEEIITKQKKLEASLVHQEKMAAFGLVAAGIAHEMGNPLSSIEMHLQLIDDSKLEPEDAESIETLRRETARLRRTLRELVDFARRRRSAVASVSVDAVIRDALQLVRYDPRMRNVVTTFEAGQEIPAVKAVEDHLMQVMVNLLINAIDAMPDGGQLRIDTRHVGDKVAIRVRDDGHGMPKATLDRCFEPLFTTKDPGKGTGLGLSICRDVLEAAHGRIELHSAPGRGTTVVVTLPEEAQESAEVKSLESSRRRSGGRESL